MTFPSKIPPSRIVTKADGLAWVHYRQVYYLPSWQGGDCQQPLCQATVVGWCGGRAARFPMTDDVTRVTCPHCLDNIARGGRGARNDRIIDLLSQRKRRRKPE